MSRRIFPFLLLGVTMICCQYADAKGKKDKKMIRQLQADITYLSSDELEGRRTSYEGERKAADYIEKRYKEANIPPYKNQYRYPFGFVYGKEISGASRIRINKSVLRMNEDAFPLPFGANRHVSSELSPEIMEQGSVWLIALYADETEATNPHFNAEKFMFEQAKDAEKRGASGVVFYEGFKGKWEPVFNKQSEYETLGIPVVFLQDKAYVKYIKNEKGIVGIDLNVSVNKVERTGNNIAAYIDNKAPYTVIVGAHYDHLGYGEDGNSLYANAAAEHQIHHGADDNASGTAAVLELAQRVKAKRLKHYNYLFVNFSGEELGLYGSKAFVKDQHIDSAHIAYMINLDMIGRLNDSTHSLEIGGIGTSPEWNTVSSLGGSEFKVSIDSSGTGPSDHTSFYNVGIPVLFFFTGQHQNYHKPSDKADLINYAGEVSVINYVEKVLVKMDAKHVKPAFTATKQKASGKREYKVTLGIMPDYTYKDNGVLVDGVTDNRPAMKAGVKRGDIITKLGPNKIGGMQSYMEALGKFAPGDKTEITLMRNGKEMVLPVEMAGKQ